jgi:hypothetical protein
VASAAAALWRGVAAPAGGSVSCGCPVRWPAASSSSARLDDSSAPQRWQVGAGDEVVSTDRRPDCPLARRSREGHRFWARAQIRRGRAATSTTVGGRQARARWSWPACRSVVEACHRDRKAAQRRRYGGWGARSDVLWTTSGWREVLPCCMGKPERRLREEVVVIAMPLAAWVLSLLWWSCWPGGMGCPLPWRRWSSVSE